MIVTKAHILEEIKGTAEANGGQPLGRQRFYTETGSKETDWSGKYWVRWIDALREAGYSPNQFQSAYNESYLLEKLAAFVRDLGHFPVFAEPQLKRRQDSEFPTHNTLPDLAVKLAWTSNGALNESKSCVVNLSIQSRWRFCSCRRKGAGP